MAISGSLKKQINLKYMCEQPKIKKLSEYLKENVPDVKLEDAMKSIIAYREYMFNLRGNKDQLSNYCDICYKLITEEEASKTSMYDYNYCCKEHVEYKNAYNVDRVRKELGLTVEHLAHIDIYG